MVRSTCAALTHGSRPSWNGLQEVGAGGSEGVRHQGVAQGQLDYEAARGVRSVAQRGAPHRRRRRRAGVLPAVHAGALPHGHEIHLAAVTRGEVKEDRGVGPVGESERAAEHRAHPVDAAAPVGVDLVRLLLEPGQQRVGGVHHVVVGRVERVGVLASHRRVVEVRGRNQRSRHAGLDQRPDAVGHRREARVVVDGERDAAGVRRVDHGAALGVGGGERLGHEHVDASACRFLNRGNARRGEPHVPANVDVDHVEVDRVEHFPEVREDALHPPAALHGCTRVGVRIGGGHRR